MRIYILFVLLLLSTTINAQSKFVFNNGAEPDTLDPQLISGLSEMRLAEALYEGLLSYNPKNLTPQAGVAKSWKISQDGLHYTFYINPNAKWSDGTPVTAYDFVLSWQRALTVATAASYVNLFFIIDNAQKFYKGKINSFSKVGIYAKDPLTLKVKLSKPCSYFLDLMAFVAFYPIRIDLLDKYKTKWTQPKNLVTNGAFTLDQWNSRQSIILIKNRHYWDAKNVKLDKVVALAYDDINTAYKMFLEGSIDWLPAIPTQQIDEIKLNPDYYVSPYLGTYFYRFNITKKPFDNVHFRRALIYATDRQSITKNLLKGGQKAVSSFCPPVAGYHPVEGCYYNPTKARQELKKSGYGAVGKKLPPIEILYNTSESHKQIAETIASQWKQVLGIDVISRNQEWKVYLSETKKLHYQVARSSWIGDYGDPSTFFSIFRGNDSNNRTGWNNSKYNKLLNQAQTETNPKKRLQLFQQMELLLVKTDPPILPIYRYVNQGMLREYVMGWYENIRDIHPMKYIYLDKTN